MSDVLSILREVFGYQALRGPQADIIDHVVAGGDALVLMPTGGGKSLCYQIPAIARQRAGHGVTLWKDALQQQVFLGDNHFIQSTQKKATQLRMCANEVPRAQRATPLSLDEWLLGCATQDEAIACAYLHSHWTMTAIAKEVGLSVSRVSRIIRQYEQSQTSVHTKLSTKNFADRRPSLKAPLDAQKKSPLGTPNSDLLQKIGREVAR